MKNDIDQAGLTNFAISWPQTIEYFSLNLGKLKAGDQLETVETWLRDGSEPTTYTVDCVSCLRDPKGWVVSLLYDCSTGDNPSIASLYPDIPWGTTTLTISTDLRLATASFCPERSSAKVQGECHAFPAELYESLSRSQVSVLLRPGQAKLRKQLFDLYPRCAISDEAEPTVLEAAHVIDHGDGGIASCNNALLLRADLHTLFDSGKLWISSSGEIELRDVSEDSRYHAELKESWNRTLPAGVLHKIGAALKEREGLWESRQLW
ncbi:HNH endonuclease [Cupriavidus sp. CuC1]|uniref:HNH endonuclease n=1 Tax=Cupriavidus sp. CuC1 TaxID=3373131 RepID=UPI0037D8EECE